MRARGLKRQRGQLLPENTRESRPMRARGLKRNHIEILLAVLASRPMRARGLKHEPCGFGM